MRQRTLRNESAVTSDRAGAPGTEALRLLSIRLLGTFQLRNGAGEPVALPRRKAQALLAFLAVTSNEEHSREKLATLLWGSSGTEQARQSLRQTLFTLRRALGPSGGMLLPSEGETIRMNPELIDLDIHRLEELARTDDLHSLEEAAELYHGEFLEGLVLEEESFDNWLRSERERLHELILQVLTRLFSIRSETGPLDAAIQIGFRILALDSVHEATHRQLMRLYSRSGRREAAIRQFHACADLLRKRLGVAPEAETRRLFQEISQGGGGELPQAGRSDQPPSILLIEDNALNRELVRAMLAKAPYELVVVEDGAQALLQLGSRQFDLILLDLALPTLDGYTLIEVLRRNGIEAPIIVLTAFLDEEHEVRAFDAGAVDFIRKPFHAASLLKRIERALAGNRLTEPS
jgi:DNA-binding SARP family transcriptional activator